MPPSSHRSRVRQSVAVSAAVSAFALLLGVYAQSGSLLTAASTATAVTLGCYIVAARTLERNVATCEAMRGALVGVNAALNALVLAWLLGGERGLALAALGAAVTGTSVLTRVSRSSGHHALLGYCNWLLPSSWPVVALGGLFVGLSLSVAALGCRWRLFRILGARVDAKTGTLFLLGGVVANLNYARTAFNMGPFVFVHTASRSWHWEHEIGHSLNLAAFGSAFHLIGAWDENISRAGARAFAERLAESHVPGSKAPLIPIWRPDSGEG